MARAILFDLDGTLVDTRSASWELFCETNRVFKLGIDSREAFFQAFEVNFFEALAKLCSDADQAAAVKSHFLGLLRSHYHPPMISGMVNVVRALAPRHLLAVMSSNAFEIIRRILMDAGIAACFARVFSGDMEPRKTVSIRRFLDDPNYGLDLQGSPNHQARHTGGKVFAAEDVVLVTDTVGDVLEAREAGIRAIGVAWGMHTERQLLGAGADRVAFEASELIDWLSEGGDQMGSTVRP
jgi:phosphoglycolate phosphatase